MSESRASFGGLGAVFFLAAFGAIAFFVQRQTIPDARDELRKPVTVLPDIEDQGAPAPVPWEDRIALNAMQLTPIGSAGSGAENVDPGADVQVEGAPIDEQQARFVQALGDGHELLFSIDPVLQNSALTIFRNREVPYAAAVILDLRDNSVLAMAGYSKMDPQVDPLEIVTTAWAPAASTFKLVTAASLLAHDKASPSSKECFHGGLHGITDDLLKDNNSLDTRCESLSSAIAHSYNLVIAKLALKHLDQASLVETAQAMLFESDIPFEFPIERSPALIPADANERAKVAAGFWHVDQSPMHAAIIASIFARGGIYQPPHVISQVRGPDGADLTPAAPKTQRVLDKESADAVAAMMLSTTTSGTAKKSFYDAQGTPYIPEAQVGGKTGSLTGKRAPALNYNWFIGFAPVENPEIAFAVVLANEPQWRIKAHYAARRLVQIYLQRREAITAQRETRLTGKGLGLPARDPETGVVVATAAAPAAKTDKDEELPPVPGPTPTAEPPSAN